MPDDMPDDTPDAAPDAPSPGRKSPKTDEVSEAKKHVSDTLVTK